MDTDSPRPEHPRPQLERPDWLCLNGVWTCELDTAKSGWDRELWKASSFGQKIVVPFAPESKLSGLAHTDFIEGIWYHRKLTLPPSWKGKRILLHFGAVDYACEVFIDGIPAGRHWGGTTSFTFDLTRWCDVEREHDLVVAVRDDVRAGYQPSGKQSTLYHSHGCHYTRTTGIWQSVWIEAVHPLGIRRIHLAADAATGTITVAPEYLSTSSGTTLEVEASLDGSVVARAQGAAASGIPLAIHIPRPELWAPGSPRLYELTLSVYRGGERGGQRGGELCDRVSSYTGLRTVTLDGSRVLLNGQPLYQRLVLDQGFYPDGIWTAPEDAALKRDIELSLAAGFNGARLHQKVFEERFHYWADRLGYLTWGESSSWGCDVNSVPGARAFLTEWSEIVLRDRNHPSIVAWSPFNETSHVTDPVQHNRLHADAYELTRGLDPSRPVNDASGYVHVRTDLWTVHSYEQDPARLRELLAPAGGQVFRNYPKLESEYSGQPYLVDEFGGIKWDPETQLRERDAAGRDSWGYGRPPQGLDEFYARLEGLVEVLLSLRHVAGYCYTQLTDVEQERNGVYAYDRGLKFDMARIRRIFSRSP